MRVLRALKADGIRQSAEQQQQQGLLRMQAVFGLIEDDGLRAVEHCVGDFGIAARGQAVHEDRVRRGLGHQRLVHLEGPEDGLALGGLVLEAHADAHVGVDRVGAFDGGLRVLQQAKFAAVGLRNLARLVTISMSGE